MLKDIGLVVHLAFHLSCLVENTACKFVIAKQKNELCSSHNNVLGQLEQLSSNELPPSASKRALFERVKGKVYLCWNPRFSQM